MSGVNLLTDASDEKILEGWIQRREKVTELDFEWKPRWVVFTKKRWLVYESPYALEQALTGYSIPHIASMDYQRQVKEFSFVTPASGRVDFRMDSVKMRDKWVLKLKEIIPVAQQEQLREMMQRKAESQAAREFAEIQRNAAFNTVLQAENLIICLQSYRSYARNLAQTLMQLIYFADIILKEGMNAAKPLSETIMELVDRSNSTIAISRSKETRAGVVMYSVKTCRQAAEMLTYAKTAASSADDLQSFVQAANELKRIVAEFLDFLERTSMLADLEDTVDSTSTSMGRWMDGIVKRTWVKHDDSSNSSSNNNNDDDEGMQYAHVGVVDEQPLIAQQFQLSAAQSYAMPSVEQISSQSQALLSELESLSGLLGSAGLSVAGQQSSERHINESALRVAYLLRSLVESSKIVCDMTPSVNREVRDGNMLDCTLKLAQLVELLLSQARPGQALDAAQLAQLRSVLAALAVAANVRPELQQAISVSLSQAASVFGPAPPVPEWLAEEAAPPPPPSSSSSSSSSTAVPVRPARSVPPLPPRSSSSSSSGSGIQTAAPSDDKPKTPSAALQQLTERVEQAAIALSKIKSTATLMQEQQISQAEAGAIKERERAKNPAAADREVIVDLPPQLLDDTRELARNAVELLRAATDAYKEARRIQKAAGGDAAEVGNPKFLVFAARLVLPAIKKLLRVASQDEPESVVAAARLLNYTLAQLAASARAKLPPSNAAAQRLAAATGAVQSSTKAISNTSLQCPSTSGLALLNATDAATDGSVARLAFLEAMSAMERTRELEAALNALRAELSSVRQSPDAKSTKLSVRGKALEKEYEIQRRIAAVETQLAQQQ